MSCLLTLRDRVQPRSRSTCQNDSTRASVRHDRSGHRYPGARQQRAGEGFECAYWSPGRGSSAATSCCARSRPARRRDHRHRQVHLRRQPGPSTPSPTGSPWSRPTSPIPGGRRLVGGPEPTWLLHFAAESHNDSALADPTPFVQTSLIGTFAARSVRRHKGALPTTYPPATGCTATSNSTTRPASPRPPPTTRQAVLSHPKPAATCCAGVVALVQDRRHHLQLLQQLRAVPASKKFIPGRSPACLSGCAPAAVRRRTQCARRFHVDDHNDAVGHHRPAARSGRRT